MENSQQRPAAANRLAKVRLEDFLPEELKSGMDDQSAIPRIAKDGRLIGAIEVTLCEVPTSHSIRLGDARQMDGMLPESVHLVLTSPPYWTLKQYRKSDGQLGYVEDYGEFRNELRKVWSRCSGPVRNIVSAISIR